MYKPKVLHIIDSLGRGGAETLLVGVVNTMSQYDHIIVSLNPVNEFKYELTGVKVFFLNFKWLHSIPACVSEIKKIIEANNVNIVHAHLYWSTIISRLATPSSVKLFNSYHNILYSSNGAKYPLYARLLDKLTYQKRICVLCVSGEVKRDIEQYIGVSSNIFVLYNYIEDAFFERYKEYNFENSKCKFVAVGNLKSQKNYEVLLRAIALFNNKYGKDLIELDVFGKGPLLKDLIALKEKLVIGNVYFKGVVSNVAELLPDYTAYILCSKYEGFGIAVAEAMAVGLPVIVSNLPVLKEVTFGDAIYFDPNSPEDLCDSIDGFLKERPKAAELSKLAYSNSQVFRKEKYMQQLASLYES